MGRILLALVLGAGCTHAAITAPAWPKSHEPDKDGGESLAPHESTKQIAVVEKADEDAKPEAKPEVKPEAKPAEGGAGPAASPAVTQPTEEAITTEEIIIEIDE